jgi:phosphomannomutase
VKKLIVFDLDGTLAESKSPVDAEMSALLHDLLLIVKVAVISGGDWTQFEEQLLSNLPQDGRLKNLSLLPTSGTKFYQYDAGAWQKIYSDNFTSEERGKILSSLQRAIEIADFKIVQIWGEQIEDRGSQITFSALGQHAPLEDKMKWDPDFAKRRKIKSILDTFIPEFSVRTGGSTSVDITKPGIDKAYGIGKLRDLLGIPIKDMIYIGDALYVGGNDNAVKQAGVDCISVKDPNETRLVIETIVACLALSDQAA